ncbi:carbamoyl-phosphate synthetase large chain, oligomerization domain protein, partial [Mycobacterium avium MAV_120809_2495]
MTLTDANTADARPGIAILRESVDTAAATSVRGEPKTAADRHRDESPVSRSSALASKARVPIAKIAAKLASVHLDEIVNDITRRRACFEPPGLRGVKARVRVREVPARPTLTTTMKSVGEAMSLAATSSSAGKVMRSLETSRAGFWTKPDPDGGLDDVLARLQTPTEGRLYDLELALRLGAPVERVAQASGVDPWFIAQIGELVALRGELIGAPVLDADLLRRAKHHGLSDRQIAALRPELAGENGVRSLRERLGVHPVYKTVDTCAAEFEAKTPYHYSSYELDPAAETEVAPQPQRPKVLILGSGPNRIGQGIEFDYSCVHAATTLSQAGFETVMVNCNPETVSTDYDTADRLYFEPLTFEDVLEVFRAEQQSGAGGPGVVGVIVQLGGQTPLGLAQRLADAGV